MVFISPTGVPVREASEAIARRWKIQVETSEKDFPLRRRGRQSKQVRVVFLGPPEACQRASDDLENWLEAKGVF